MSKVINFPTRESPATVFSEEEQGWNGRSYRRRGSERQTLLFLGRQTILKSEEADLIGDVCLNVDRAQTKLRKIRERATGLRKWAEKELGELEAAEVKLSAAIISALLSKHRGSQQ